eukprot:scaffold148576_cov16-Tisochrysis_lutea.AAC.1
MSTSISYVHRDMSIAQKLHHLQTHGSKKTEATEAALCASGVLQELKMRAHCPASLSPPAKHCKASLRHLRAGGATDKQRLHEIQKEGALIFAQMQTNQPGDAFVLTSFINSKKMMCSFLSFKYCKKSGNEGCSWQNKEIRKARAFCVLLICVFVQAMPWFF